MLSTLASYTLVVRDLDKSLARVADEPVTKREIADFKKAIGSIDSIEEFLANDRVYKFAMRAFGLENMAYAKAFMRKVLEEGITSRDAFANKLSDKRYREFAEVFNFKRFGAATTTRPEVHTGVVERFTRQTLEKRQGEANEGVRLALYFQRKAASIKNPFDMLADPALAKVARTVMGLPDSVATADIDKQAKLIKSRIKIEDFKDEKKLEAFLARFTAMYDAAQPNPAAMTLAALMAPSAPVGPASPIGMSTGLLLGLQTRRS